MNLYCESCNGTCYCKEFEAEQEAIERLQEMPTPDAVEYMWNSNDDNDVDLIAKVLEIPVSVVCEILGVDS